MQAPMIDAQIMYAYTQTIHAWNALLLLFQNVPVGRFRHPTVDCLLMEAQN